MSRLARSLTVLIVTIVAFGAAGVTSASALNLRSPIAPITASEPAAVPSSLAGEYILTKYQCLYNYLILNTFCQYEQPPTWFAEEPPLLEFTITSAGTVLWDGVEFTSATGGSFEVTALVGENKQSLKVSISANGTWSGTYESFNTSTDCSQLHECRYRYVYEGIRRGTVSPELSIAGTTVAEPTSGTTTANFPVTLSAASTNTVTVEYTTQNGSGPTGANAPGDYAATHGILTFNPGETSKSIPVTVKANGFTGKRTFTVALSNAQGAGIATREATGTIEGGTTLSVGDVDVTRPSKGTVAANFVVSLSHALTEPVTFTYRTVDGTPHAKSKPADYKETKGTATIAPGELLRIIPVQVHANPTATGPRTFSLEIALVSGEAVVGKGSGVATIGSDKVILTPDGTHLWANGHDTVHIIASVTDADGVPLPSGNLDLTSTVSPEPKSGKVDFSKKVVPVTNGTAEFDVASTTEVAPETTSQAKIKAALTGAQSGSGETKLEFLRHKIVVQFLGITTALSCDTPDGASYTCTDPEAGDAEPNDAFLDDRLAIFRSGAEFDPTDFLWYSYNGGSVNSSGEWIPRSYQCPDTANSYRSDIAKLRELLVKYTKANPNTDLYLMGHSQGGLLAFQALALRGLVQGDDTIRAVVTLDSPLGGVPRIANLAAEHFKCWKGPAGKQLAELYETTRYNLQADPGAEGDKATPLCELPSVNACAPDVRTNFELVKDAREEAGIDVYTFGSTDDAIYTPFRCIREVDLYEVPETQVVSSRTGGGLFALDHDEYKLGDSITNGCIHNSHVAVMDWALPEIEAILGNQDQ